MSPTDDVEFRRAACQQPSTGVSSRGLAVGTILKAILLTCASTIAACGGGGDGQAGSSASSSAPAPTLALIASPTSVASGSASTLTWSSANATNCTASGDWSGSQIVNGSTSTGPLTANASYTLACTGAGGSVTQNVNVTIDPPTLTLVASPTTVVSGGSSTLTWSSINATNCLASGAWSGNKATSGTVSTGSLTSNSTFTLTCSGPGGNASPRSATVTVSAPPPAPTLTLSASPTGVASGSASTLTWSSTNATSCLASGAWSGTMVVNGTASTGALTTDSAFTLSCSGAGGSVSRSVGVTILPAPTLTLSASSTSVASGSASTLTWSSTNATSCTASGAWSGPQSLNGTASTGALTTDSTFTLSCGGPGGSVSQTAVVAIAPPTLTLSASPTSVASGGASTLTWTTTSASSCTASGSWSGLQSLNGTASTGALTTDSTFTLSCSGAGGSVTRSVGVTILPAPTLTLSASPTSVASGSASTLTWSSSNATSCLASSGWSGTKAVSGTTSTGALTTDSTFTLSCSGDGGTTTKSVSIVVSSTASLFPLHTVSGTRYLLDSQGNPFLIQGDSAWSLMVQLTDAEVDQYLDNRRAKGFNAVLVSLLEHKFANNAPNNTNGVGPFLTPNDFSTPNEAYFAHAASVIQKAADRNMLVLLTPAYLGYQGGDEGWYQTMGINGATKLRAYGQYLANRFSAYSNIVWVNGGDYNPPSLALVNAVANGIRDVNTTWLHTYHGAEETSPFNIVGTSSWLGINNVYSYDSDVTAKVLAQYNASTLPLFLIESLYEGTGIGTAQYTRSHAYQALLAGASGQIFGNNPVWHFDAPHTVYSYTGSWKSAVNGEGSVSMQRLHDLWASHAWQLLQPNDGLVSAGHAALASDRSYALAYFAGTSTVQLNQFAPGGANVSARWYNPFTGAYTSAGTFPASETHAYTTPGNNGSGTDWVLVLEAAP